MKLLDDEMRAALEAICGTTKDGGAYQQVFAAGYRMGLERAAKVCDVSAASDIASLAHAAEVLAAAIRRKMAHD